MNSSFSDFIHFPRKRTLTGWAVLFAMGKHTSKEFLYDREHVRVWKCRKTGTKVRSKSGSKTGPDQHPQPRKRPYTGKSSLQRASKKGSKMEVKNGTKIRPKRTRNRCLNEVVKNHLGPRTSSGETLRHFTSVHGLLGETIYRYHKHVKVDIRATGGHEPRKSGPTTNPKMVVKYTSKIASGTISTTSHFSKAGLRQTAFGGRI